MKPGFRIGGHARGLRQEQIVLGVTAFLVVVFSVTVSGFMTADNLLTLGRNVSTLGILGTAMAIVVIGGGMDLSLVATMGVATAVSIQLMGNPGTPTAVALGAGLAIALGMGLLNGTVIAFIEVPRVERIVVLQCLRAGDASRLRVAYRCAAESNVRGASRESY